MVSRQVLQLVSEQSLLITLRCAMSWPGPMDEILSESHQCWHRRKTRTRNSAPPQGHATLHHAQRGLVIPVLQPARCMVVRTGITHAHFWHPPDQGVLWCWVVFQKELHEMKQVVERLGKSSFASRFLHVASEGREGARIYHRGHHQGMLHRAAALLHRVKNMITVTLQGYVAFLPGSSRETCSNSFSQRSMHRGIQNPRFPRGFSDWRDAAEFLFVLRCSSSCSQGCHRGGACRALGSVDSQHQPGLWEEVLRMRCSECVWSQPAERIADAQGWGVWLCRASLQKASLTPRATKGARPRMHHSTHKARVRRHALRAPTLDARVHARATHVASVLTCMS